MFKRQNKRCFINSAIVENDVGKIDMYGDVYEEVPKDWWTGEPIVEQAITLKDFKDALNNIKNCSRIELHLNSYGGDATVGLTIRNLLKSTNKHITCVVEGIAASAAFTIASGCDEVQVYKGSLMMCHKVMSLLLGYYNNDDLQEVINGNEAYDNASAAVYAAKTGMSETQCLNLMKKVTWMTGQQAIDYGFADTMLEGEAQVELVNKNTLKVNGIEQRLMGMNIPDEIVTTMIAKDSGGNEDMAKNVLERFKNHINAFFENSVEDDDSEEKQSALNKEDDENSNEDGKQKSENEEDGNSEENIQNAIKLERERLQAIDAIAKQIDSDLVQEAKYGKTACNASELAFRAMQREAEKGNKALQSLESDNENSKANDISSVPGATTVLDDKKSEEIAREQAVKELMEKINKSKEEK